MNTGVELIAAERQRQVEVEGFDAQHDDEHDGGSLGRAAVCYITYEDKKKYQIRPDDRAPAYWPWEPESWRPSPDKIRNLVKAGALIAAEIDRLQRAKEGVK
jgi:hypothetical protein